MMFFSKLVGEEDPRIQGVEDSSERPLKNTPFRSISALGSNFNPRNTICIPVVKIIARLELNQN